MKKILYSLIAVLAMIMSSCSNDDIEIVNTGGVTLNVNTQGVYDEFDINVKDIIRDKSDAIKVFSFLYDKNGNLVDKKETMQFTTNTVSHVFDGLPQGNYTILVVETLVDADDGESTYWKFENVDRLDEIKVAQQYDEVLYPNVLGVIAETITVGDNGQSLSVTPKAVGSMIEFYGLNFDKSNYVDVGLGTEDRIEYYMFNPNLSRAERFYTDRTASDTVRIRGSKKIANETSVHRTVYVLENTMDYYPCYTKNDDASSQGVWTHRIPNEQNATLEDGKTYYVGAYYVNDNSSLKCFFGDADGFKTWYTSLTSTNSLVPELYMTWGGSVSKAQSFMNGYSMTLGKSGQAVLVSDGSYEIDYKGKGKESLISYFFKTQTTGLFEVDVRYPKNTVTKNEIMNYLTTNYSYVTSQDETYMYMSADGKTVVIFFSVADEWDLGFVDTNYLNSSTSAQIKSNPKAFLKAYVRK